MAQIEMVIDSIRVSLMNYQRVVILKEKEGERYLPCWIGPAEADSIAVKMQGVRMPRPLTHDFVCSVIDRLGATVESAVVSELKKDTFYAKLLLNKDGKEIETHINQHLSIESAETGLTSAVKEAIKLSIAEAKRLGAGEVQTEHILLGLIRQKEGIANNLLKNRGIDVESVYIELIRSYNQPTYKEQEPPEWKIKQS